MGRVKQPSDNRNTTLQIPWLRLALGKFKYCQEMITVWQNRVGLVLACPARCLTVGHLMLSRTCIAVAVLSVGQATLSAQETGPQKPSPEVIAKLAEAQELQGRQRFVDALAKLDEVEALMPELSQLHNLRGSLYLSPSLRDFGLAEAAFRRAQELDPKGIGPRFNLAELHFVKHDWQTAYDALKALQADYPKTPEGIRHLILFKQLICELKLDKLADAKKTLERHFTFMDDTPAYYYSKSAIAFNDENEDEGKVWITRAESIFKPREIAAYQDTMMETRWVMNIGLPPIEQATE